ncbi:homeodomain-like protein, partial [Tanacetum coccineum]
MGFGHGLKHGYIKPRILALSRLLFLMFYKLMWHDHNRTLSSFSVAKAQEAIRPRGNQVGWFRIVWFSHNIPRHAFHLWLVMRKGLKTHDRMKQWDVGPTIDVNLLRCSLCNVQPDSHTHLFFECAFSAKPMGSKRTLRCIFGKLIMAAAAYFIWLERNNITFKNVRRSPKEIRDIIMVIVHLKLLSLRFKKTNS